MVSFFDKNTSQLVQRLEKILQAAKHRAFHPETKAHQDFLKHQLQKIKALETQFSFLSFEKEMATFRLNLIE